MSTQGELSAYKDLLSQREELDKQIKAARERELADAIALVRKTIADFGLTASDVFRPTDRRSPTKGSKVEPKYRNPETGETWTGRGKAPVWIRNGDRDSFRIRG